MKNKIFPTVQSPDNDVWYGVQSIVVNYPWQVEGTLNVNAKSIVGTYLRKECLLADFHTTDINVGVENSLVTVR